MSIISEKLHGLLGTEPGAAPLTKPLMVDIVAPSIDKVHIQVELTVLLTVGCLFIVKSIIRVSKTEKMSPKIYD